MMLARDVHVTRWETSRVKRVVATMTKCEVCGAIAFGPLCADCREKSRQHVDGDPYDIVGGEG